MGEWVRWLTDIDATQVDDVGGKAALLGELTSVEGVTVPPGFCVTTAAFRSALAGLDELQDRDDLPDEPDLSDLERVEIPHEIEAEIRAAVAELGEDAPLAVRSSATAEDQPSASFAGQHDTFLNVVGADAVLRHVRRCWASLSTDRAVAYRRRNGIDDRTVEMAVVVQALVDPDVSGILFTADPVTSNRRVAAVAAGLGLGEAFVAGQAEPDTFTVRDDVVLTRSVAPKPTALRPLPGGGTAVQPVDAALAARPALTDEQVLRLVRLGRLIEAHFGRPQDIEWCLVDDELVVVQSRPITTLYPVPVAEDHANRVYVSVGHQQMMTEAMKPLGISFWQLTTPAPAREAGSRLFVDITARLSSPSTRDGVVQALGSSDPLLRDALTTVLERGFVPLVPDAEPVAPPLWAAPADLDADPALVEELVAAAEASIAAATEAIAPLSGIALFEFVREDLQELRRVLFEPRTMQVILTGMEASRWLNETMSEWLGVKNAADVLTRSVPQNVTAEMGLALLDVADAVRPHPEVVAHLRRVGDDEGFLEGLPALPGGSQARAAIEGYLERYGMRCVGEIDITRARWRERPTALLPALLADVDNFGPGAGTELFERGRQEAEREAHDLLERVRLLPDGATKAEEAGRMIARVRTFTGYREFPKYAMVRRYFVYKQALLAEAERLVGDGVLRRVEDAFLLRFDELEEVVRTGRVDLGLLDQREAAYLSHRSLVAPRVLTSEGETIAGRYHRDGLPPGALAGLPVSVGTVEGRARVVTDIEDADVEPGDILVTSCTDPSWTPVFVTIAGLVTEVGGLMTHGAVIAREYGLPAVVGVERATLLIEDGRRIRIDGTDGHVELL